MKVVTHTNKNDHETYYYIQRSFRKNGKSTTETVKILGKHSELLKTHKDPMAYAEEEKNRLEEEYKNKTMILQVSLDFAKNIPNYDETISKSIHLQLGYFFIQYILGKLSLRQYCKKLTEDKKVEFQAYTAQRFMIYERLLDPCSKLAMITHLGNYYEQPDLQYQHVLRYMDILGEDYEGYIEYLYKKSQNLIKRNASVCYYDCTNFYNEVEREDEDYIDEVTGETIKGLRKYGASKEHRPNPIVSMGLFVDTDGIPITMCIFSGSQNEQLTALPLEREMVKMFQSSPFIYCADAGLGSYDIRKYNTFSNRNFVVTQSIKKLSGVLKDAVFDSTDYYMLDDSSAVKLDFLKSFDKTNGKFHRYYNGRAFKVIPANQTIILPGFFDEKELQNGSTKEVKAKAVIKQYLIVTFSRKTFEYQRHIRNNQVKRARALLDNSQDPEEIKKGPNDVRRFIKAKRTKDGKDIKTTYYIDEERIHEEEMYDGFYCIATSLPVMDKNNHVIKSEVEHVLKIMEGRYQVEEDFRIMKTDFEGRPVYHRLPIRIKAHFLVCYTALLVHRIMEKLLDEHGGHYTTEEILATLRAINMVPIEDKVYMACYKNSKILTDLTAITQMNFNRLYYAPNEFKKIIKSIL